MLNEDRFFDANPVVRTIARTLYARVRDLPLVCPHGHIDLRILATDAPFPDPTELIIIPDHYIFRMLYSQGIRLESLGIPRRDGGPVERDHRRIWQLFADHFHLFRGTPTSCWLRHEFEEVFGVGKPLNSANALSIYDEISEKLRTPAFRPRALFERFRISVLCTTDGAADSLEHHKAIRESGWQGDVRPSFRPDTTMNLLNPAWKREIQRLAEASGCEIGSFRSFVNALEMRRKFFKEMGATSTDHAPLIPFTAELSDQQVESIFARALKGEATEEDALNFSGHFLMEMARMSAEDGLVMQLHPGSLRDHNPAIFNAFGPDKGCDIPIRTEFTRNLRPLLNKYGNESGFRLVLFTLDESTYARELAPLAGHYPAVRLGPPWWFHDSREGMIRFRRQVTETAGIYNTAGFNDDTRAFPSIPARHDLCRRVDCSFLAGLVAEHVIDLEDAEEMIVDLSFNLAKETYRL
jgi:glucuronate isomerase